MQKTFARFPLTVPTLLVFLIWGACSPHPYRDSNRSYRKQAKDLARRIQQPPTPWADSSGTWIGTTNFDLRRPNFVIIHHTAQTGCPQTLSTFTTPKSQVSAHYVICKDGVIHHLLNDYLRAWQAGVSRWGNNTDLNSSSIGIELDNNGFETFSDAQISSLLVLLDSLKKMYRIPPANFIGHGDIAPTRKVDPNWRFPWKQLADKGFGLWFSDTTGLPVPDGFSRKQALRIIGYDLTDSSAALAAFKRHWLQDTVAGAWNEGYEKVLYSVSRQFLP